MPVLTHIPEILEEHFEELAFLLHFRSAQVLSSQMLYRQLIDLDDRIEGHIQGLLAIPDAAMELAVSQLAGDDALNRRASAYILLYLGHGSSIEKCLSLLQDPACAPPVLDALLLRRASETRDGLKKLATTAESPMVAALATAVLAEHFPRDINSTEFGKLLTHAEAPVRSAAWRAAQRHPDPRTPAQYRAGCGDQTPAVRDAAMVAAAWAGQPFVLEFARPLTTKPTPEALVPLRLLAILAPPAEAQLLGELAKAVVLGPARFDLLASSGLPAMVPHLLAAMRLPDPATSAAGADAFARLTNFQPPSNARAAVSPPPPGGKPDAFEKEFVPEVNLPDAEAAQKYWNSVEGALGNSSRIARGQVVDPFPPVGILWDMDCAARDAILLRSIASSEGRKMAPWSARWSFPQRLVN